MNKKKLIIISISGICFSALLGLLIYARFVYRNPITCPGGAVITRIPNNCGALDCKDVGRFDLENSEMMKFIFTENFRVEQEAYCGGDWPSGKRVTILKKGSVVSGKYVSIGCSGEGCIPEKKVMININGQNWTVDTTTLQPIY